MTVPTKDTHKYVREKYLASPVKMQRKIGSNLARLWKKRKEADYEDNITIGFNEAKDAYGLAFRTLEDLKSLGAI